MVGATNVMKKGTAVPVVLNQEDQDHHNALDQGQGSGCSKYWIKLSTGYAYPLDNSLSSGQLASG